MNDEFDLFARIPVRFERGKWVTRRGSALVAAHGTRAEFLISKDALPLLEGEPSREKESLRPFLSFGGKLLIALAVVDMERILPDLANKLVSPEEMKGKVAWEYVNSRPFTAAHFFPIVLGKPVLSQEADVPNFKGGLLLKTVGRTLSEIKPSEIQGMDGVGSRRAYSLNHALTILSEVYEVHRVSHTGNIFERIFYQEADGKWYPLEFLRHKYWDGPEKSLARAFWDRDA